MVRCTLQEIRGNRKSMVTDTVNDYDDPMARMTR